MPADDLVTDGKAERMDGMAERRKHRCRAQPGRDDDEARRDAAAEAAA
jgi:hypothetical protein